MPCVMRQIICLTYGREVHPPLISVGGILLRGKGQIIYLMAAGGRRRNYRQNYEKQIAMPINLNLQFLKGRGGFRPGHGLLLSDGWVSEKVLLALSFAWQGAGSSSASNF